MKHRLLVLGSMTEFIELVKTSKDRGYYTIVCDGYKNGPAKAFADKAYDIDVRDVDAIAQMCLDERVDGIIGSFSDLLFEQITKIAAKAQLRWYAKPESLRYYREKNYTKGLLDQLGVHVPRNVKLSRDFKDSELDGFRFPLVIKPVNGYGSKGIFVIHSIDEIRSLFDQVTCRSNMDDILVEEYSPGREYNMMTWVYDGKVYPISIADREKNPQKGRALPTLNRVVYPAKDIRRILPEATTVLQKFADAVGQREGALSMQFFYNEGGVEVCEIAGRLFGYEHEMVTICSGFSIENLLLDYVYEPEKVGQTMRGHSPIFDSSCAGLYFLGIQDKVIADMSVCRELARDPHVIESQLYYSEGEKIDNYGANPYLVRYYVKAPSRQEVDEVTERFFSRMRVTDASGDRIDVPFIMEKD